MAGDTTSSRTTHNSVHAVDISSTRRLERRKRSLVSDHGNKENSSSSDIKSVKKKKKKKSKDNNTTTAVTATATTTATTTNLLKTKKKKKKTKVSTSKKAKTKSHEEETTLTNGAVESLVQFAHSSSTKEKNSLLDDHDIVVRLTVEVSSSQTESASESESASATYSTGQNGDPLLIATIDDGTQTLKVLLWKDPNLTPLQTALAMNDSKDRSLEWTVALKGVVTTTGHNPKYHLAPLVCLTSIEILEDQPKPLSVGRPYCLPCPKAQLMLPPPSGQQAQSSSSAQQQQQHQHQQQQLPSSSSHSTARVRAGSIGTLLEQTLDHLTNEELAQNHDCAAQHLLLLSESDDEHTSSSITNQHAEEVQTFLTRHAAMMTLQAPKLRSTSIGSATDEAPHSTSVQNYTNALREFAASQLDRQKASLMTNAGRETEDRAALITVQHNTTLHQALHQENDASSATLTPKRLSEWHSTLLQDLHAEAGQIRTKTVRAGHTVFCRPTNIQRELDTFCTALGNLQARLDPTTNAWHAVLLAAVAMYGVVDIHPFADGNGRMSRIAANWALRHLPFTINLFATPVQRSEYVLALERTRHLWSLSKISGKVSKGQALLVTRSIGVFAPLVGLLMDRVARAVVEFHRVWQEKSGLAAEALEYKAARQARERAKEGTCIICLDEDPNIATLCCGKAVHLNCIAEWLSAKNSCPCCRSELPSISGRVVRAASAEEASPLRRIRGGRHFQNLHGHHNARDVIVSLLSSFGADHNEDQTSTEFDNTTTVDAHMEDDEEGDNDSEDSEEDSEDDDDDDDDENDSDHIIHDDEYSLDDGTSGDATSGMSSSSSSNSSSSEEEDGERNVQRARLFVRRLAEHRRVVRRLLGDGTNSTNEDSPNGVVEPDTTTLAGEDDEEEREGGEPGESGSSRVYCDALYCRNRPAVDCSNSLCGRCCVLGGEFHCPRHNS